MMLVSVVHKVSNTHDPGDINFEDFFIRQDNSRPIFIDTLRKKESLFTMVLIYERLCSCMDRTEFEITSVISNRPRATRTTDSGTKPIINSNRCFIRTAVEKVVSTCGVRRQLTNFNQPLPPSITSFVSKTRFRLS